MVVYAMEKEASKIDLQLTSMDIPTFQYLSFKYSSSEERLGAMHANEVINVKARFETLYNVNLEQDMKYQEKTKMLGQVLKEANHNQCPLFLAVENGSGVNKKDVHVVINPQVKLQALR